MLGGVQRFVDLPEDYRDDLTGASGDIEAFRAQGVAAALRAPLQFPAFFVHPRCETQRRGDLPRKIGRERRAEDKCTRVVDEVLLQYGRSTNEGAGASQRFSAGV